MTRTAADSPAGLPYARIPRLHEAQPERPREKLMHRGARSLTDRELLSVVLNAGIPGHPVGAIAADVLSLVESGPDSRGLESLRLVPGMGEAQAARIAAMLEFGRRFWGPCGDRITKPEDLYPLIRHYADRSQERFLVASLDGGHEVLAIRMVTLGLVNRTIIHPREAYADPLRDRACAVIVAHNHPSGRLEPSAEDREITRRLQDAGQLLGITLLDHIIFSERSFYSFQTAGLLP